MARLSSRIVQVSGGGVSGSGTTSTIPLFSDSDTIADSSLLQDADDNLQTSKRLHVIVDLNDAGEDPALKVTTNGTNIGQPPGHALDGGVQSFHHGSYDTTMGQRQSFAGLFSNDSTVGSGAGGLIATGIEARATGGTENYGIKVSAGTGRFDDDVTIADALTVGSGAIAATGETKFYTKLIVADNTKQVTLGNNVDGFLVPGTTAVNPQIGIGTSGDSSAQLVTKNTVTGQNDAGIIVALDTTVASSARGGFVAYRGVGGGVGGSSELGMVFSAGSDFIVGINAGDVALFNTTPNKRLCLSSDGSGFTMGAALNGAGVFFAKAFQVGSPSAGTGAKWTSGTGSPEGAVTGSVGDLFSRTDGGAGTTLYVKESGAATNTGWVAK